jgi:hypothetical protein
MRAAAALLAVTATAAAAPAPSMMVFGAPRVSGAYDADRITATLQHDRAALLACFATALKRAPRLEGALLMSWTIGETGKVVAAHAAGLDNAPLESCFGKELGKLVFAKPAHAVDVRVAVSLESPTPLYGAGMVVSIQSTHDDSYVDPMPPQAPKQPWIHAPAIVGAISRDLVYRNMFAHDDKLAACSGVPALAIAELTIAAGTGAATDVAVSNVDATVAACVAGVIAQAQFVKPEHDVDVVFPITFFGPT